MRYHKDSEPEHEYCYKCDVDCEDDSALLVHMIESCRHSEFETSELLSDPKHLTDYSQLFAPSVAMSSRAMPALKATFLR